MPGKNIDYIVLCDGLRVAQAPTEAKAKSIAYAMGRLYPPFMVFTVEPRQKKQSLASGNKSNPKGARKP